MGYKGLKVFSFMPVRGGSTGIPKKNMKKMAGKPLLTYTIEASLAAETTDRTITITENPELANTASIMGSEVYDRPAELADNKAQIEPSYIQVVKKLIEEGDALIYVCCFTRPARCGQESR